MTPVYDDPDYRPETLARMSLGPPPPPPLEERVVRSLHAARMLRPINRHSGWLRWTLAAAALLLTFIGGRMTAPAGVPAPEGRRWMVLLYEDAGFQGPAPGAEQSYVDEYRAWAMGLRQRNQLVDAAELLPTAAVLEPNGTPPTPGPGPGDPRLTGYFIIVAPTVEAARAITSSIPHLRHQGRVVIQPLGAS
jgi:hypothetical protein